MKIEKISDNQIKCTLTSEDLDARNIRLSDLAYGSAQTRKLFREMMHEADIEVGFRSQGAPLMVEAIPTSSDSIMLIITRVDDPDELDARFSRFTRPKKGDFSGDVDDTVDLAQAEDPVPFQTDSDSSVDTDMSRTDGLHPASSDDDSDNEMQGLEDLFHKLFEALGRRDDSSHPADDSADSAQTQQAESPADGSSAVNGTSASDAGNTGSPTVSSDTVSSAANPGESVPQKSAAQNDQKKNAADAAGKKPSASTAVKKPGTCGFEFPTLDSVIEAAHSPAGTYHGRSVLYRRPDKHGTYLLIVYEGTSSGEFTSVCSILSEYGHPLRTSQAREAFLAEHGDTLIRSNALAKLMSV